MNFFLLFYPANHAKVPYGGGVAGGHESSHPTSRHEVAHRPRPRLSGPDHDPSVGASVAQSRTDAAQSRSDERAQQKRRVHVVYI
jgi:hypothetical protein